MKKLTIEGWLVRDKDDYTAIYKEKPTRGNENWFDSKQPKNNEDSSCFCSIFDARLFSDLEFEDEPKPIKLTIEY